MLYLFIDTNIFLAFYHFTSEDLEELKKLAVLIEHGEIRLLIPDQVLEEFERNRASKIADAVRGLREQRLSLQFPQLCKDYLQYEKLRALEREYDKLHAELMASINDDIKDNKLNADALNTRLFALGTRIDTGSDDLLKLARRRVDVGNPPGKNDSYGDALNWEGLLDAGPVNEPLHLVTDDRDYASPLDNETFNEFLLKEWRSRKGADVIPYRRLSEFFKSAFPQIKLAGEIEKDLLIRRLAASPNFATTHSLIAKLRQQSGFSAAQANALVSAALNNDQVRLIINDNDVESFYRDLIKENKIALDAEASAQLTSVIDSYSGY